MGIFNKKKPESVDMSKDKERLDFIEKSMKDNKSAEPIPTELSIDVKTEPLPTKTTEEVKKALKDNIKLTADFVPMEVSMKLKIKNRELLTQMLDGVAEIAEKYDEDTIVEFKVEKCK